MPYIHHQLHGASVGYYQLPPKPGEALSIGRNQDNHLVVDDPTASGYHAVIEATEGGYRVRDLSSTNGVWLNGKRVEQGELTAEDNLVIGTHDLQLVEQLSDELQRTLRIKKSWIPGVYYTAEQ